jgi:hypothetical protein
MKNKQQNIIIFVILILFGVFNIFYQKYLGIFSCFVVTLFQIIIFPYFATPKISNQIREKFKNDQNTSGIFSGLILGLIPVTTLIIASQAGYYGSSGQYFQRLLFNEKISYSSFLVIGIFIDVMMFFLLITMSIISGLFASTRNKKDNLIHKY